MSASFTLFDKTFFLFFSFSFFLLHFPFVGGDVAGVVAVA